MDRGWLEEQLTAGRSIESIAREVDRDASTVSYWVRKHGLQSSHAERHAARGGIERELLTIVVKCGLPVRDMSEITGRSPTTVRHWLRRYGLTTGPAQRRAKVAEAAANGDRHVELSCDRHGNARHARRIDGYRCTRCEAERVTAWRQRTKRLLVEEAGGACALCGYARASPPSSSTTSTGARRASRSAMQDRRARSGVRGRRRESAYCCAPTVMRRWKLASRSFPKIERREHLSCVAQNGRSGVAQWQSIRLLIEGLWVRVPPPELGRGRRPWGRRQRKAA
jgi:transposase